MTWRAVAAALGVCLVASSPVATSVELPRFRSEVRALNSTERRTMTPAVWRPGCPVGLDALRRVRALHVGFGGRARWGSLVVHRDVATDIVGVLREAYAAGFPIRKMVPIERYRGSDSRSVSADNTSAFNCRFVAGTRRWSEHAYGRAIDINPIENPYVAGGERIRRRSLRYLDRSSPLPGMLVEAGSVVAAFGDIGWTWGGRWRSVMDYQHFSASGR